MSTLSKIVAALFLGILIASAEPPSFQGYQNVIKVTPLLKSTETLAGQPIVYPTVAQPQVTAAMVEIPPGAETGWHQHPYPCYAYLLSGQLTVELADGTKHEIKAGEAFAESVNLAHNGKNTGTETVRLVMFVTGEVDKPFTVKEAPPK